MSEMTAMVMARMRAAVGRMAAVVAELRRPVKELVEIDEALAEAFRPKRNRYLIPPGATRVEVGWNHEDEDFRIVGYLTPGQPERGPSYSCAGEPTEPAEFCPLAVVEDWPGGKERPELLPLVEQDLDDLTAAAEEEAGARAEAAEEDRADEERGQRHREDHDHRWAEEER